MEENVLLLNLQAVSGLGFRVYGRCARSSGGFGGSAGFSFAVEQLSFGGLVRP